MRIGFTKKCVYCGLLMEKKDIYCRTCGKRYDLSKVCASCGEPFLPNAKFCKSCGKSIKESKEKKEERKEIKEENERQRIKKEMLMRERREKLIKKIRNLTQEIKKAIKPAFINIIQLIRTHKEQIIHSIRMFGITLVALGGMMLVIILLSLIFPNDWEETGIQMITHAEKTCKKEIPRTGTTLEVIGMRMEEREWIYGGVLAKIQVCDSQTCSPQLTSADRHYWMFSILNVLLVDPNLKNC